MSSLKFCFLNEVPSDCEVAFKAPFRAWHTDDTQEMLLSVTKSEVRDSLSSSLFEHELVCIRI